MKLYYNIMLKTGQLIAADDMAGTYIEENEVINLISNQSWSKLIELVPKFETSLRVPLNLSSSFLYSIIDNAKKKKKRGNF